MSPLSFQIVKQRILQQLCISYSLHSFSGALHYLFLLLSCMDPEGGDRGPDLPPPSKIPKIEGFLAILAQIPLQTTKLPAFNVGPSARQRNAI